MAAVFVFLSAGTKKSDNAIAGGGYYLACSLGEVSGIAVQNCVLIGMLRSALRASFGSGEEGMEVRVMISIILHSFLFIFHIFNFNSLGVYCWIRELEPNFWCEESLIKR